MNQGQQIVLISGCVSGFAIFSCILLVPLLHSYASILELHLAGKAKEFKAQTDELWQDLREIFAKDVKAQRALRQKRQYYGFTRGVTRGGRQQTSFFGGTTRQPTIPFYVSSQVGPNQPIDPNVIKPLIRSGLLGRNTCQCRSICPPGPPGRPGIEGSIGFPGIPGQRGKNGLTGEAVFMKMECPICPRTRPGVVGQPGFPGSKGKSGNRGRSATPGMIIAPSGPPGPLGSPGRPGMSGRRGGPGRPGQPSVAGGKGKPGRKGNPGKRGPPGKQGMPARVNMLPPGFPGKPGNPGQNGRKGTPGTPGQQGAPGQPGDDAHYCPCPKPKPGRKVRNYIALRGRKINTPIKRKKA